MGLKKEKGMKAGILTTFSSWSQTYSLVHIVASQVRMLSKAGHEVVLFVNTDFNDKIDLPCEVRKIVPVFTYENYSSPTTVPNHLVELIKEALEKELKDIDICITHDFLLQDSFIPHNLAIRKINLPIIWRHWIHSQPNNIKISNLPMGHKLVFLNYSDRLSVAERYCTWMDEVGVVYNPIMPWEFKEDRITKQVSKVFENKDVRIGYAFCTTRMGAKGVDKLLKLAGKIKNNGKSVGLCLMNSNANAEKEKKSIQYMSDLAINYGLTKEDFIFTSTLDPTYECGIPHHITRNIFHLSNLFIFPSISECCSLVLLEAMSGGNLLVLNDDIPSMKEFGGFGSALYMKFGSIWNTTNYSNEDNYYNDWAKIIIRQLDKGYSEKSIKRAELFSEDNIWETQMKDLI
jgi:hypothetical protein